MAIRVVYGDVPKFPATDQHPDARRFYVYAPDRIVPEQEPSEAERQVIEQAEVESAAAADRAGNMVRLAEFRRKQMDVDLPVPDDIDGELPIEDKAALETARAERTAQADASDAEASEVARDAGLLEIKLLSADQRTFLKRIHDPEARAAFIRSTRARRRVLMAQVEPLLYVVDAIGDAPTWDEIQTMLNPEKVVNG